MKIIRNITKIAVIAALYAALCVGLAPFSFGLIQLRLADILKLLAFYNKKYIPALVLGVIIANVFSPFGPIDILFGIVATSLFCLAATKIKSKKLIPMAGGAIIGTVIGFELWLVLGLNLLVAIGSVAAGVFLTLQIGVFIFMAFEKNPAILKVIKDM